MEFSAEPSFMDKYGKWIFFGVIAFGIYWLVTSKGETSKNAVNNNNASNVTNARQAKKVMSNTTAAKIRARQTISVPQKPVPVVRPVIPQVVKTDVARRAAVEIKSSRQPLNVPAGPQQKEQNQVPAGDYRIKLHDRFVEPNLGRDKIENGWLVARTDSRGVWNYKDNRLTFDFDGSPFGSCLSSMVSNKSLACIGMNTALQVCDKGRNIYLYKDGKILFDGKGYLHFSMDGTEIHPTQATAFDLIQKN